jgi:DNA processing protein
MIDQQHHRQAIHLHTACNMGTYTTVKLLRHFGSIENVFAADDQSLSKILSSKQFQAFKNNPFNMDGYLKKHMAFLAGDSNHFITWDDPKYPQTLKQTDDAPVFLYIHGQLNILGHPAIAIVGSRNADERGLKQTHEFANALAQRGFCIVSGFAQGVDGMAHQAALEIGAPTIAVLGAGLEIDYPKAHANLRQAFNPSNTCLISEFLLDAQPLEYHFPRRNRTIAALSAGVLVTQAELKSGSLITARLANELGRDVFAIPYGLEQNGQGCNHLIQQGAKLVLSEKCITEEYYYLLQKHDYQGAQLSGINLNSKIATSLSVASQNVFQTSTHSFSDLKPVPMQNTKAAQAKKFEPQNDTQKYIISALEIKAQHFDELLQNSAPILSHDDLQTELFLLELDNLLERRDGGFYHLIHK